MPTLDEEWEAETLTTACTWCGTALGEHSRDHAIACLASLAGAVEPSRTYQAEDLEAQYRAGVLTQGAVVKGLPVRRVDCCPACGCTKSGDMDIPNRHDDWCIDSRCVCHREKP